VAGPSPCSPREELQHQVELRTPRSGGADGALDDGGLSGLSGLPLAAVNGNTHRPLTLIRVALKRSAHQHQNTT